MFSNKKLFIGVFLASLGTLAIVGGRLPSLRGTAFTGQATGIPESSSSAFSSARSSSSTRSGTNSSEDGKQTSKSSAGDDGCSGQKTMYPDDYKKVAKGETIVHVWEEIFTGIKRQLEQASFPKGGMTPTGDDCRKMEQEMNREILRAAELLECAMNEQAMNQLSRALKVLTEQLGVDNTAPLNIMDLWYYLQAEMSRMEQVSTLLKNTRDAIYSPVFRRCSSERPEPTGSASSRSSSLNSAPGEVDDGSGGGDFPDESVGSDDMGDGDGVWVEGL